MLNEIHDTDEFLAVPLGRIVAGRCWLVWCATSTLYGGAMWGRPEEDDVHRFIGALRVVDSPTLLPGFAAVTDLRHVESVDALAFAAMAGFVDEIGPRMASRLARHAIVRPESQLPGSVVAGFYDVVGPARYPRCVFAADTAAFAWIGAPNGLIDEVRAAVDQARLVPDLLRALQRHLREHPADDLYRTARGLGVSARSLQRRLGLARTSFREQRESARVAVAAELLADTQRKIASIALAVGCATPKHFGDLFRRATGETPGAFRARSRSSH